MVILSIIIKYIVMHLFDIFIAVINCNKTLQNDNEADRDLGEPSEMGRTFYEVLGHHKIMPLWI